jgi:hypothetical protein
MLDEMMDARNSKIRAATQATIILTTATVAAITTWYLQRRLRKPSSTQTDTWPPVETGDTTPLPYAVRDDLDPDDDTLRDRVESELFADERVPKGAININVALGIVEVRGELESEGQIRYIEERLAVIPDVRTVRSHLHLPGTPTPNKESALAASDGDGAEPLSENSAS